MLPVATVPNAVVFSSGHVTVRQMAQEGFVLNLVGGGCGDGLLFVGVWMRITEGDTMRVQDYKLFCVRMNPF